MPRVEIKYDSFKIKAFLDANIILECRPLGDLPWQEIDADGPIIALITPTAIKEIDSKKQDGRIGQRAREFNRLIASVAAGGAPVLIRESTPRVELALSRSWRIPWDELDDLDCNDGDSCIVAEALHAKDMSARGKLIVSHDIKPIAFASSYDIAVLHVSDNWLRQQEPHPRDKENQRLKQKLDQYQLNEPAFDIEIELMDSVHTHAVRIEDLTDQERKSIEQKIYDLNPPQSQESDGGFRLIANTKMYDSSYNERFQSYRKQIPVFLENYAQKIEHLLNQMRVRIKVLNVGSVQAENMLMQVNVNNGWLHDKFAFISPNGPPAPKIRSTPLFHIPHIEPMIRRHVGRHEFEYKFAPSFSEGFAITCTDFRCTQEYAFEGIICTDVRVTEPMCVVVTITASNLYGVAEKRINIEKKIENKHISDVVDLSTLKMVVTVPILEELFRKKITMQLIGKFFKMKKVRTYKLIF